MLISPEGKWEDISAVGSSFKVEPESNRLFPEKCLPVCLSEKFCMRLGQWKSYN